MASLRAQLWLSHAAVLAVGLVVSLLVLAVAVRGFQTRLAVLRLQDAAVTLTGQVREHLRRGEGSERALATLEGQARQLGLRLLIVDAHGRVARDSAGTLTGRTVDLNVSRREPGHLQDGRRSYVYLVRQLQGERNLILAHPVGGLTGLLGELWPRLGLAALAGLLAAGGAALVVDQRLSRPLQRLELAADELSRAHYETRVEPGGPDEVRRLGEAFNRMADEVQQARLSLHEFLATITHELRTPLTSIRGFVQSVLDGTASRPEDIRRSLSVADQEARRMQRLVSDLLDLSRAEAGSLGLDLQTTDLAGLARRTVEALAAQAELAQVRLELEAEPVRTGVDPDRIEQLLTNLVENALRHSPAGGRVRVAVRRPETHLAWLEVSDAGPGIPPQEIESIFRRHYATGGRAGTGLGLAIAREIARAHGGRLEVSSDATGTTFRALLPLTGP